MKILLLIILIFWLITVSRNILFWVYLWQLKEYRRDRMRAHFELASARQVFSGKFHIGKLALLLSATLVPFIGLWQFLFQIVTGVLFVALGARSAYSVFQGKIGGPVLTKKALLIFGVAATFIIVLGAFAYLLLPSVYFFVSILALDILTPVVVTGAVGLFKLPSEFFKNRVVSKAKAKRQELKDVLVIGITGSYGKTSMKDYLAHILGGKLKVAKTHENHNSEIGVAKWALEDLRADCDVCIVEMGAYREGEIKRICEIVQPQMGILTGINEQHASMFGSLEQITKAKYELIESLPRQGLAIFNGENDYTRTLYEKTNLPKRMYALRGFNVSAKPDISCERIEFTRDGMQFDVKLQGEKELFETQIVGKHNVLNILGATLVAHDLGMSLKEIKERVKTLTSPAHTLELQTGINGATIIDDSYSANPRGVAAALDVLESLKGNKKILVMYPLIELGGAAGSIHKRIALKINKVCDLCILTSSDFARDIAKNAPNTDFLVLRDPEKIIQKLEKTVKEGDIVLLENRVPEEVKQALLA